MNFKFNKLDNKTLQTIKNIGKLADRLGLRAYLVGGMVRDGLLGQKSCDVDVVVEQDAIKLAEAFGKLNKARVVKHKRFLTATVLLKNTCPVDFATARQEAYTISGTLPVVKPGNIKDDQFRRDFSINAIAVGINKDNFGHVIDHFDGLKDLIKKTLRFLHARSFLDDATRILRAIRYQVRFKLKFDHNTLARIKSGVRYGVLDSVGDDRFFNEFKKNLVEDNFVGNVRKLNELGVLKYLGIHLSSLAGLSEFQKQIQDHRKLLQESNIDQWLIVWMFLTKHLKSKAQEKLAKQFKFGKKWAQYFYSDQEIKTVLAKLAKRSIAPSEVFQCLQNVSLPAIVLICSSTRSARIRGLIAQYLTDWQHQSLKISGKDLLKLGVSQGAQVKRLLDQALLLKLDGKLNNKREEINFVRGKL